MRLWRRQLPAHTDPRHKSTSLSSCLSCRKTHPVEGGVKSFFTWKVPANRPPDGHHGSEPHLLWRTDMLVPNIILITPNWTPYVQILKVNILILSRTIRFCYYCCSFSPNLEWKRSWWVLRRVLKSREEEKGHVRKVQKGRKSVSDSRDYRLW